VGIETRSRAGEAGLESVEVDARVTNRNVALNDSLHDRCLDSSDEDAEGPGESDPVADRQSSSLGARDWSSCKDTCCTTLDAMVEVTGRPIWSQGNCLMSNLKIMRKPAIGGVKGGDEAETAVSLAHPEHSAF
jgi:hypothetical protein